MDSKTRFAIGKKVSLIALGINSFLAILKIVVGSFSRSRAMIADGLHSASDSFSTIIVLCSLKVASNPPDASHPYGHERSETLAANILALALIVSGLIIVKDNILCILKSDYFYPGSLNLWAAIISIFAQEGTYRYSIYIGNKINSPAIIADALHHRSDAFSSVAAFIGILCARNGLPILDPIAGIFVAGMIIHMGLEILLDTIHEIMEKSPEKSYLDQIRSVATSQAEVKSATNIRVRKHAGTEIIELIITVSPEITVYEGDRIAHLVKDQIISQINDHHIKEVIIHVDPSRIKFSPKAAKHQSQ